MSTPFRFHVLQSHVIEAESWEQAIRMAEEMGGAVSGILSAIVDGETGKVVAMDERELPRCPDCLKYRLADPDQEPPLSEWKR